MMLVLVGMPSDQVQLSINMNTQQKYKLSYLPLHW